MVGLHSNMDNVTVIHLPGSLDLGDKTLGETTDSCQFICDRFLAKNIKPENKQDYYDLLGENLTGPKSIYENLRYFYPSTHDIYFQHQNVGIAGRVSMLSDARLSEDDEYVGPYSLVSVHETVVESLQSSQHFTTVTIGERDSAQIVNKRLTCSKSFVVNTNEVNSVTTTSAETYHELKKSTVSVASFVSNGSQTDSVGLTTMGSVKPTKMHKEAQVSLDDVKLLNSKLVTELTCTKLRPPILAHEMNYETPSSPSSYSSAYTLTEHELTSSDASTSPFTPNDFCDRVIGENASDPWPDESGQKIMWVSGERYQKLAKSTEVVKESNRSSKRGSAHVPALQHRRSSSSDNGITEESSGPGADQPRCDQKEKGDDEIWVANEAAHLYNLSDYALHWLPPPLLYPQQELNPRFHHCKRVKLCLPASAVSVPPDQRVSTHAQTAPSVTMTALMPPVCDVTIQRRHFTNRQRIAETSPSAMQPTGAEKESKGATWNKENRLADDKGTDQTSILMSTAANRPTKRFSFLVRSNSLRNGGEAPQQGKDTPKQSSPKVPAEGGRISASDKAILDRLSKLNLLQNPSNIPRPRSLSGASQPPCGRCGEPVYAQELIKPTAELFFHSACFKCYHCGLRLNLRTFYCSPSHSKDNQVFCRIHLPPLDARPAYLHSKQNLSTNNEKDIVKCDSVGLRYF